MRLPEPLARPPVAMVDRFTASREPALEFGCFSLVRNRRVLLRNGVPVRIGSRAREVLHVLTENPGQLVTKAQIIAKVWSHSVVEEGTLRVHIAALRKALGESASGSPYIENVTGYGYRFVAPTVQTAQLGT
jgi:DNA-binding winged helix-turn-helix (wHTH) protein